MFWVLEQPFHSLLWSRGMGLEAGSGPSVSRFAGVWPGMGRLRYYRAEHAWGRKGSSRWLVPLSQELTELKDWQDHMKAWSLNRGAQEMPSHWTLPEDVATLPAERGWLPWHGWPRGFRKFSEPSWRSPYPFMESCCGFFNVRLSVAWTRLILGSGHGHQPWQLSNFGPDANAGFSLGPTSILGIEPSEPVCMQVGSRRNSHVSDLWGLHFV